MVAHSGLITVMQRAFRKAAPRLRRDFGEVEQLQVSRKGPADFVSMADKRAEQTIVDELRNARPDWGMLLEESGEIGGNPDKPRWIVDPLDGTTNFIHGVPHFSISIAVEERKPGGGTEITQGLVYQPLTDESFWEDELDLWDTAAGVLLVREAGGFVTDYRGADRAFERGEYVAGSSSIHSKLQKLVAGALR